MMQRKWQLFGRTVIAVNSNGQKMSFIFGVVDENNEVRWLRRRRCFFIASLKIWPTLYNSVEERFRYETGYTRGVRLDAIGLRRRWWKLRCWWMSERYRMKLWVKYYIFRQTFCTFWYPSMSYYYLLRLSSFYFPDHCKCYLFSLVTPAHSVHAFWIALFCWFEQIKWWWWWYFWFDVIKVIILLLLLLPVVLSVGLVLSLVQQSQSQDLVGDRSLLYETCFCVN